MSQPVTFTPASGLSLEALAELFTRSFEAYFYPGATTTHTLARRVAAENIDLLRSVVLRVGGEPSGVALLARRGERAWCGGFGVAMAHRGRGLAHALAAELIEQARDSGAEHLALEVLTRNTAALRVYERAGLAITRRLLVLTWRPDSWGLPAGPALAAAPPEELVLRHYAEMHPAQAAWQREPAALLAQPELRGLALREGGETLGYALAIGEEHLRLYDFAARDEAAAARLVAALQGAATSITSVNEPGDSPFTPAFLRAGFLVADEQHEMELAL